MPSKCFKKKKREKNLHVSISSGIHVHFCLPLDSNTVSRKSASAPWQDLCSIYGIMVKLKLIYGM